MEYNQLEQYLNLTIEASIKAGAAIMEVYGSAFKVQYKVDESPLTEADQRANAVIMQFLETTQVPIISEENKAIPYDVRKTWTQCWMVDPLDGTKEFVKRNGEFTVNIALIDEGVPVLGVIYVPVTQVLYFAISSQQKAFKIKLENTDLSVQDIRSQAIQLKSGADISKVRVVGSRSHMNTDTSNFLKRLQEVTSVSLEMVSVGSSLKFCLLAEGAADIYPRFAPTMEWDTAAGQAICSALDISVVQESSGVTLRYNKADLLNPYFIAAHERYLP
ncbi:3'(2'),5'-bisphosphate nucleotidase CysQ [Paucihalobacter sp.]|uniref:3'(2'),5'-bisphosphate nucleotidase CysQ n=1 Tax=Paucihalobacter sp. TaxID=2850405 RepID=UPI002FE34F35